MDANGLLVPLTTYMDRMDPDHQLAKLGVKLQRKRDLDEVSALLVGRAKQAHHGIEDVEIKDLDAEAARSYAELPGADARLAGGALQPRRHRPAGGRRRACSR